MKKIISFLILSIFVLTSCTTPQQKPRVQPKASSIFEKGEVQQIQITKNNATCRSGQGSNDPVVKNLSKGEIYDVVGQSGKWYVIQTNDKKVGTVAPSEAKPHVETPKTPTPESTAGKLTPNEDEMLRLVNGERSKKGLKPLQLDMEVTKVARLKAQDLIDNNYFSHNSPTYGSPFDMLKKYGVDYVYAGENLAGNQTVQAAHDALMNSKGHRENILNPNFTHIGIGIKEGGKYGKMFTQMFIGR